jgi:predicted dehydrogenase
MAVSDPLRVAFVGLGRQGLKLAQAVADSGHSVAAGCDLREPARAAFRARFPGAVVLDDVRRFEGVPADVHVIATLADVHAALVTQLAALGARRFLCEKPAANTTADLARLRELAAGGVTIAINHPRLWSDDHLRIRELIQAGRCGTLEWAEAVFKPRGFGNIGVHAIASMLFLTGRDTTLVEAADFVDTGTMARAAGHADANGRVVCRLGEISFVADNRSAVVDGPMRLALGGPSARIDIFEGAGTWRLWRDGVDEEFVNPFAWGGSGKRETLIEMTMRALRSLVEGDTREHLRCAFGAAETVIGAQIAHRDRRAVHFPLPAATVTPHLFS